MDKKLFEQLLSEVSEWQIPETLTATRTGEAKRPRGRPTAEDIYQREQEQQFLEAHGGRNPTFPPQITRLKTQACHCEDCGQHCPEGRQMERKYYKTGAKKNWRSRCLTCGLHQNPFTKKFDLTSNKASHVWTDYLRETKGRYNTQRRQGGCTVIQDQDKTVIETEHETITFYPRSYHPDK